MELPTSLLYDAMLNQNLHSRNTLFNNLFWLKNDITEMKVFVWGNVFVEEMSSSKKCLDWRNASIEEMSWLEKLLNWRNVLMKEMCRLKKCVDWRNALIEELSWLKKCFSLCLSNLAHCYTILNTLHDLKHSQTLSSQKSIAILTSHKAFMICV